MQLQPAACSRQKWHINSHISCHFITHFSSHKFFWKMNPTSQKCKVDTVLAQATTDRKKFRKSIEDKRERKPGISCHVTIHTWALKPALVITCNLCWKRSMWAVCSTPSHFLGFVSCILPLFTSLSPCSPQNRNTVAIVIVIIMMTTALKKKSKKQQP